MRIYFYFICYVVLNISSVSAQDVLYTITGNKIQSKVLEITSTEIKYKDFTNIDGPTYVISAMDVVLIKFTNGTTQIINSNPPELNPKKQEPVVQKKPEKKKLPDLYYINKNLLSINALALANGDFTLIYDREVLDNHLAISFLGGYNFNSRMGALNLSIVDRFSAKKNYDMGLGINFMPRNTKRVQYFMGLMFKYMTYTYDKEIDIGNNQISYEKRDGYQFNVMFANGWIYRISPNFNAKLFGAMGSQAGSPSIYSGGLPKIYLGYCFGYRF